jgi:hypothetical protein
MTQWQVVEHFSALKDGALSFTQATLSRKLKPDTRASLEKEAAGYANALSAKRVRIVTHPLVDKALLQWQQAKEEHGESVTGPMLFEKRRRIEDLLDVPEDQRLVGTGWLQSFLRA